MEEVATTAGPRNSRVRVIRDWREALSELSDDEEVALDLETGGLSPWRAPIAVVSLFGTKTQVPCVLHVRGAMPDELRRWLSRSGARWITHNGAGFDCLFLHLNGVDVRAGTWFDTMLAEQVCVVSNRRDVRVNLAKTTMRRVGKSLNKEIDHGSWMNLVLDQAQIDYCCGDISLLHRIKEEQLKKLVDEDRGRALDVELALSRVITRMTLNGIPIGLQQLVDWRIERAVSIVDADNRLRNAMGDEANLNSPPQVLKYIRGAYDPEFKGTQREYLEEYINDASEDDPLRRFLEDVILWRQGTKSATMYDDDWAEKYVESDGRIHARLWQVGTETGRMSSSDPNIQQWPRNMRSVIGHLGGHQIVSADYDAIEVLVAAVLADDRQLIEDCRTGDPHMALAEFATGLLAEHVTKEQRRLAKAMNFTLLFCGGVRRFHEAANRGGNRISFQEARHQADVYLTRYAGIDRMRNKAYATARGFRTSLTFPTGLRRDLVGPELRPTVIVNNLVQGTAAAGIKYGLLECERRGLDEYIGAAIHDEVVGCVPDRRVEEFKEELEECMVSGMLTAFEMAGCRTEGLPVTVSTKVGSAWS